jgi:hypothetical protein
VTTGTVLAGEWRALVFESADEPTIDQREALTLTGVSIPLTLK